MAAQQPQQGGYGYPPATQPGPYPPATQPGPYPPATQPGSYPPATQPGSYPPATQPGSYPPDQPPAPSYQSGGYPQPIVQQQPTAGQIWMPAPQVPTNCPPGLEYLTQIDQILVHQQVELLEAFTGFETNNKYKVKNNMGQQIYFAEEDTDCCTRQCCGPGRPFEMRIFDNAQREVIHLSRPLRCSACCFPCCLQEIEVQGPPGNVLGYCVQLWSICFPKFAIQNANRETVLRIEGPLCQCNLCGDVEFQVLSSDGNNQVGKISKQWSGLAKEMFTDADNFGITFPMDLDVNIKAVVLGACFLIDFMFFETSQQHDDH